MIDKRRSISSRSAFAKLGNVPSVPRFHDTDGLHFYLDDWLGTRRVQTDFAGDLEQTCQSLPYGDGESCGTTPTEHLFTGKERDTESGNDYFEARYYGSCASPKLRPSARSSIRGSRNRFRRIIEFEVEMLERNSGRREGPATER